MVGITWWTLWVVDTFVFASAYYAILLALGVTPAHLDQRGVTVGRFVLIVSFMAGAVATVALFVNDALMPCGAV